MLAFLKKTTPKKAGTSSNVLTIPTGLRSQIHLDPVNQTVYVNQRLQRSTDALDWIANTRRHPQLDCLKVVWEPISDVTARIQSAHETGSHSDTDDGEDAEVRDEALALLREGAESDVSDIHIHRKERHTEVQFRINGSLVVAHELTNDHADRLLRAMYTMATSRDSAYSDLSFQDAAIAGDILKGTGLANVRIVKGPCLPVSEGGKFMVIRLQYVKSGGNRRSQPQRQTAFRTPRRPEGKLKLLDYGFTQSQVDRILNIAVSPSGVLICTGPTGSGKTTLLYELALHKARTQPERRQVEIAQPAEYPMHWGIQLDISNALTSEEAGREFRARLRTALRMDPDDLSIAEMRDSEVALTTFDSAQTGHFVMSTLHVDDPFDYPLRFQNMDFERLSFRTTCNASIVRGVVAQRLLPVLCKHCSLPWTVADERLPRRTCEAVPTWGEDLSAVRRKGPGCPHCFGTGISGRTTVAEVVETDEQLMSDFVNHGVAIARHRFRARPDADPSMVETAMGRVFQGLVDPFAVTATVDRIRTRDAVMSERLSGAKLP
ncbi:ATPase, T2SS/T4P/T4SS family [Gluconobacter sp. OJB]|uniref:GspE/PulE family protein n=1 Tax=Gluconobacter sp. OJB TaxID=3145196 RepID=UPI0031FA0506